ncbi:MAG: transglycosylase domain-containing protein [Actinomycetaceae bacterium]|nr:transglycosylase domain-containing protein [Actinomycetaceae bacterium]
MADSRDSKNGKRPARTGSGLPSRRSIHHPGSGASASTGRSGTSGANKPSTRRKQTKKSGKNKSSVGRKVGLGFLFAFLIAIILAAASFIFAYATIKVPEPGEFALAQKTTVYYADGETELGTFAEIDRTIIDASTIPDHVGHAVVASEDRTFFTNSGIDLKGIARAMVNNLRGGDLQGASTLSQQYVERYYLDTTTSYVGKMKEAILALKINQQQSKDQILENYLNTIYFGRGAYGIEEASKKYFGHSASELTLSESALLAGIIPAPSAWDPAVDPQMAQQRFERVLTLMVEDGWITQQQADEAEFPEVVEATGNSSMTGWRGHLMQQIRTEIEERAGITAEDLDSGGYAIVSTLDKDLQANAVEAVQSIPDDHDPNLQIALSSINPENGEIYAEYAGGDYQKRQSNSVTQDIAMAGSTMKPFGLLAYMEEGGTLKDMYNGNSPLKITDNRTGEETPPLSNYADLSFGYVNMLRSTALSINTSYVGMNNEMGPEKTRETAVRLGIPEETAGLDDTLRNILGSASPHNIDLTRAYSTIASGGMRTTPHIVRTVSKIDGTQVYQGPTAAEREFSAETVSAMLPALQAAAEWGSAEKASAIGRPVGAKTGSSEENRSAQFAGFIPQMATVVTMYQTSDDGSEQTITPFGGEYEITGSTWPGTIWQTFMLKAIEKFEVQDFDWYRPDYRESVFDTYVPPTEPPTEEPTTEEPTEEETEAPEPTDPPEPSEETEPQDQPNGPPEQGDNPDQNAGANPGANPGGNPGRGQGRQ